MLFAFLEHLLRGENPAAIARVTIIEKRPAAGVGLAWSSDDALAEHLATLPTPVRRCAYGDQQAVQFRRTAEALRESGLAVDVRLGDEVTGLRRRHDGYFLTTAAGCTLAADIVVLAIGHGTPSGPSRVLSRLGVVGGDGEHFSPWPARALQGAIFGGVRAVGFATGPRILIVGSYHTAIDAALSLALRAGRFVPEADGSLCFEPARDFVIVLASRSGQLPSVWHRAPERPTLAAFNGGWIAAATRHLDTGPCVPLEAALDLLGPPFGNAGASSTRGRLRAWAARQCRRNPLMTLRSESGAAWQASLGGDPSETRATLTPTGPDDALRVLSEISPYFCAEDQLFFNRHLRTAVFNLLLPMALPTAMQLEALCRSGNVHIIRLGRSARIGATRGGGWRFVLRRIDGTGAARVEPFSDIVDGTSLGHDLWQAHGPLLRDFAVVGPVGPGLRGFRSGKAATRLARGEDASAVVWRAGGAFWRTDGIFVNPRTCAILGNGRLTGSSIPGFYAMGALLPNQFIDARSLGQAHRDASRIAADIFLRYPRCGDV